MYSVDFEKLHAPLTFDCLGFQCSGWVGTKWINFGSTNETSTEILSRVWSFQAEAFWYSRGVKLKKRNMHSTSQILCFSLSFANVGDWNYRCSSVTTVSRCFKLLFLSNLAVYRRSNFCYQRWRGNCGVPTTTWRGQTAGHTHTSVQMPQSLSHGECRTTIWETRCNVLKYSFCFDCFFLLIATRVRSTTVNRKSLKAALLKACVLSSAFLVVVGPF